MTTHPTTKKGKRMTKHPAPHLAGATATTPQGKADAALAADLRKQGVQPIGQALQAALNGERNTLTLLALNVVDGVA